MESSITQKSEGEGEKDEEYVDTDVEDTSSDQSKLEKYLSNLGLYDFSVSENQNFPLPIVKGDVMVDILKLLLEIVCKTESFSEKNKTDVLIRTIMRITFPKNPEDDKTITSFIERYRDLLRRYIDPTFFNTTIEFSTTNATNLLLAKKAKEFKDLIKFKKLNSKQLCSLLKVLIDLNEIHIVIDTFDTYGNIIFDSIAQFLNFTELKIYLDHTKLSYPKEYKSYYSELTRSIKNRFIMETNRNCSLEFGVINKLWSSVYVSNYLFTTPAWAIHFNDEPPYGSTNIDRVIESNMPTYAKTQYGGDGKILKYEIPNFDEELNGLQALQLYALKIPRCVPSMLPFITKPSRPTDNSAGAFSNEVLNINPIHSIYILNIPDEGKVIKVPNGGKITDAIQKNHRSLKKWIGKIYWNILMVGTPSNDFISQTLDIIFDERSELQLHDFNFEIQTDEDRYRKTIINKYDEESRDKISENENRINATLSQISHIFDGEGYIMTPNRRVTFNFLNFLALMTVLISNTTEDIKKMIVRMKYAADNGASFSQCYPHPLTIFCVLFFSRQQNRLFNVIAVNMFLDAFPTLNIAELNKEYIETIERMDTIFGYYCKNEKGSTYDDMKIVTITKLMKAGLNPIYPSPDSLKPRDLPLRQITYKFENISNIVSETLVKNNCMDMFNLMFEYVFKIPGAGFDILVKTPNQKKSFMNVVFCHYYWMIEDIFSLLDDKFKARDYIFNQSVPFSLYSFLGYPFFSSLLFINNNYANASYIGYGADSVGEPYGNDMKFLTAVMNKEQLDMDLLNSLGKFHNTVLSFFTYDTLASLLENPLSLKYFILYVYLKFKFPGWNDLNNKYSFLSFVFIAGGISSTDKLNILLHLGHYFPEDVTNWNGLIWNVEKKTNDLPWVDDKAIKVNPLIYLHDVNFNMIVSGLSFDIIKKIGFFVNSSKNWTIFHALWYFHRHDANQLFWKSKFEAIFKLLIKVCEYELYLYNINDPKYDNTYGPGFINKLITTQPVDIDRPLTVIDLYRPAYTFMKHMINIGNEQINDVFNIVKIEDGKIETLPDFDFKTNKRKKQRKSPGSNKDSKYELFQTKKE